MHLDMTDLSEIQAYATMTQTIIPRPVAWILTDNGDKTYNLAPFSYFNGITADPPMVMFSIGKPPVPGIKDTRTNIEARKEFIIHIAHREQAEDMTKSSATMPHGESEIEMLDLKLAEMPGSHLPRLADCRIAYSCELEEIHMIKDQAIVFASLKHLYLDDAVVGKDAKGRLKVDGTAVDPIGRLGGGEYLAAGDLIYFDRPA